MSLDSFIRSYIETALWSSTDNADESGGAPLDNNYDESSIAPDSAEKMHEDCETFYRAHRSTWKRASDIWNDARAGHDYWLTRNRHGVGFWDRGAPADIAKILTDAAHADGACGLYVGDDGLIHQS